METMKHLDGHAPSAGDTVKLNEIVTWLVDHGYSGMMLVHKGDVGVSWLSEPDPAAVRHLLINSVGHILNESRDAATDLIQGILLVADEVKRDLRQAVQR